MRNDVLQVNNLRTHFFTEGKEVPAVDDVSFRIKKGEIVGIVGESGCGKSVTSLSIMQLIPNPPGKIVSGSIIYDGQDLVKTSEKKMRNIRGNEIGMIFQEPMTSLDPVFTIGNQLIEAIRLHQNVSKKEARMKAIESLKLVGIPRAESVIDEYPHQLSGGMRQRVMIAMAMSCDPNLLIADEPTTALDVTIQAQILDVMRKLNRENDTSILLITHDLGVVAEMCDRVIVMYAGKIVESGNVRDILKNPQHPYTQGLIRSLPNIKEMNQTLYSIPGNVVQPSISDNRCRFAPRCSHAYKRCYETQPDMYETSNDRSVRCFLYDPTEQKDQKEPIET